MRKKIISLILSLIPIGLFSQSLTTAYVLPYFSLTNYTQTFQKDNAITGGLYAYYGLGLKHSLEGDISYSNIHYRNLTQDVMGRHFRTRSFNLRQADITAIYTNLQFSNLKWRIGVHTIFSNDSLTNNGIILFAGINRYRTKYYNAGIDVYASFYRDYTPELKVLQVTGTFGFNFGNYFTTGSFYMETKGIYIRLSDEIGFNGKQFPSVKQSLFYYRKRITLSVYFWTGFQVFAVRNDGFLVFNLAEKHLGAWGGSVRYDMSKKSSLTVKIAGGRFKELGLDGIAHSYNVALIAGYTL